MTLTTKRKQRSKLYRCILTSSSIRNLPDLTEYLRCKSEKILENMFKECFEMKGSMYFGYHKVQLFKMKISNFPEVMTVEVKA